MRNKRGRFAGDGRNIVTPEAASEAIRNESDHFHEPIRSVLEGFLHCVANADAGVALRCADSAVGILHQLNEKQQALFLAEAASLAGSSETDSGSSGTDFGPAPEMAANFFLSCVELPLHLDDDDLRGWIAEGREIASANPKAGEAYFSLESAASIAAFRELRRSAHVSEVSRVFGLYCTAAGGKSVGVKSTAEAPKELVREGHHLPLTDGETIFLPEHLNNHPSYEENFDEYKVLAAHQAGYIEFGTFALDIDAALDHADFQASLGKVSRAVLASSESPIASHYELFFRLFDDDQLARDIFFAVEDARVDFKILGKYRGLAPLLRKTAMGSLAERPDPNSLPLREALVEALLRLSISGRIEETLPREVQPLYRRICGMFSRILYPEATANDSAVATARIYSLLDPLPNISLQSRFLPAVIRDAEDIPGGAADSGLSGDELIDPDVPGDIPDDESLPYSAAQPTPYRGQTRPEAVQLELALEMLRDAMADAQEVGIPLTREMLEELLKKGAKIKITQMTSKELAEASGLFVTDLEGIAQGKIEELSAEDKKKLARLLQQASIIKTEEPRPEPTFHYDEWDYLIDDYRPRWCTLREIQPEGGSSDIAIMIRKEHSALISAVRKHFQRVRPEMLRRVKRLRSGEEIELDDVIEAAVDRRAGLTPSDRIYQKCERRARDVATAFLLDLSASTDEWIVKAPAPDRQAEGSEKAPGRDPGAAQASPRMGLANIFARGARGGGVPPGDLLAPPDGSKRVIDIEREALVIMAEALESLGDEYAIYGFSGYGRDSVEFLPIKEFGEAYSEAARCRIGALKPRKSTRMGPAIRHSLTKLESTGCRLKVLILLSDGYPQDYDYGPDRSTRDYGLHDTAMALQEARRKGIHTFCVTVDQAGNDYLREMCGGENYLVVKRPAELPRILPRIYRGLTV
jgi:hypothetical protein